MRRRLFSAALAILAACGGESGTTPPPPTPPPPPPGGTVPSVVTIQAGDGQQAVPGTKVTVKPVVAVKDAAGRGVAGVIVSFTVDSGGGSLQSGTATTVTDGTASPGDWTLGSSEGRNVLRVSVASLATAKIVATAVAPTVTLATQTVGSAGGTITITTGTLTGASIRFPSSALATSTVVTVSTRSASSVTLPAGVTATAPLLVITAPGAALTQPAILKVPMTLTAGSTRQLFARTAAGGLVALPTITADNTTITVALGQLRSPGPGGGVGGTNLRMDETLVEIFFSEIADNLAGDFDSGFRPGVDDWDFARQPIAAGAGGALVDPAESMAATAIWYFNIRKASDGPLWQRFQEGPGIPESNRRGLRWVGLAGPVFTGFYALSEVAATLKAEAAAKPQVSAKLQFHNVRIQMSGVFPTSPKRIVPVLLFAGTSVDAPRVGIAYRTVGNTVELAIPDQPGQVFRAEFDALNGMKPFTVSTPGGGTYTVTGIGAGAGINWNLEASLVADWPSVVAGTIGASWPATQLRGFGASGVVDLDATDLVLLPLYDHWWKCPSCTSSGFVATNVTNDDRTLLFRVAKQAAAGTWGLLAPTIVTLGSASAEELKPALSATSGFALYQAGAGSSLGNPRGMGWIDWKKVLYRRLPTTISPKTLTPSQDTTVTFTGTVPNLPAGARFEWKLVSPTGTTTPTTTLAHTAQISSSGLSRMILTVIDGPTGRPIGVDTATIGSSTLSWRLTSFVQTSLSNTYPANHQVPGLIASRENARTSNELRDSILARPGGAVIELYIPGRARPTGFVRPDDITNLTFRANVTVADTALLLTFPRGAGLLVDAVASRGFATAPAIPAGNLAFLFTNAYARGTILPVFTGRVANWAFALNNTNAACQGPAGYVPSTGPSSVARSVIEFSATVVGTGLIGTITYITQAAAVEIQAVPTVCAWEPMSEIRRTFSFTAVAQ